MHCWGFLHIYEDPTICALYLARWVMSVLQTLALRPFTFNFAAKITKDFMGFISVNTGTVKTVLLTALDYISVQNTHCDENRFALIDGIQTSLCLAPLLIQFNSQEFGIKWCGYWLIMTSPRANDWYRYYFCRIVFKIAFIENF